MGIFPIVMIILIVLIVILVIGVLKKLLKIAIIVGLIFLVLFLVTGGSIVSDFNNLKDKLSDSGQIVLLEDEGKITKGFIDGKDVSFLGSQEINALNGYYEKKELDKIIGDNYKVFIIKSSALDALEKVTINNKDVTSVQLKDYLSEDIPISSITYEDLLVKTTLPKEDMQSAVFAYTYLHELKATKNPVLFFRLYKEGEIMVYPESAFFKFVKIVPLGWISEKLNILEDKVREGTDSLVNKSKEKIKEGI